MNDFEQELKNALARKEPSPFFEARVVAAARRESRSRRSIWRFRWASAIAAVVLALTGVVTQTVEHRRAEEERARGEAAKARLMLALRITGMKLEKIQQKVDAAQSAN